MFSLADRFVRIEIMTNRACSQASDLNITNPLRLCFSAVCLCLCVCVCVCLSTLRSLSLPLSLSVSLSVSVFVCLCLCLSLCLAASLSLSLSLSLSRTRKHTYRFFTIGILMIGKEGPLTRGFTQKRQARLFRDSFSLFIMFKRHILVHYTIRAVYT